MSVQHLSRLLVVPYPARFKGEECVIAADAYMLSRMPNSTSLSDENVSRDDEFACVLGKWVFRTR